MTEEYAVEINGLTKTFGQQTAVDQVSFNIKRGEVFGLLGPNGAGKTTTLRMMTTLLQPTSGDIKIFGHDVKTESQTVRSLFGLTGQYASVDEDISARENLMIFSRLNGLSRQEAKARTAELKAQVGGAKLRVEVVDDAQAEQARGVMANTLPATPQVTRNVVEVAIDDINTVVGILQAITAAGVTMTNMSVEQPSMDDVFFALTVGKN